MHASPAKHVSSTSSGRALGCWADVRRHPEKVLPVQMGLWKTRYCLPGPSQVSYFKKRNLSAEPDEVIECGGIKPHPNDSRVACLQQGDRTVAWLMLVDAAACKSFITAALPVIQALPDSLQDRNAITHTPEKRQWAAGQLQLEALQAQLERHETELKSYRERFADSICGDLKHANTICGDLKASRHSMPAGCRARSASCSSSSSSDDEPLVTSTCGDMTMDWPLSRAEKKMRLMQIMDKERAMAEKQNRRLKRQSLPDHVRV